VTSFEFRVHPIPPLIMAGMLVVPNDQNAGAVARAYRDYVENASPDLVSGLATILAPPADFVPPELVGQPVFGIIAAWLGDPGEAEQVMAPLKEITAGGVDLIQPMPYTAFQSMIDDFAPPGWLNYHRGQHLAFLTDGILDDYLEVGRSIGSPMTQGIIFRNGGAISQIADDQTAASNRGAPYMAHPIACWQDPADTDREIEWVHRFSAAFEPALTGGVYLNFEPDTSEAEVRAGFGDGKYERLAALKEQWDPDNVFSGNHNVAPKRT
jgi:FAD/FMN-containing dehydrogenase